MESLTDEELNNLRDELLFQLFKDAEIPFNNNLTDEQKQKFLYALIVMRHAERPDEKLLNLQNKYLTAINNKAQIEINNLKFKNNFYFFNENSIKSNILDKNILDKNSNLNENVIEVEKENKNLKNNSLNYKNDDILNFNADLVLIISDTLLEDAEALANGENSMDNNLLFKAGIEYKYNVIKKSLGKIDEPIIENGYCLPAKYIAKIIYNKNLIIDINNEKMLKKLKNNANFIKFFNNLTNNLDILFNFIKNNSINSAAIYIKENPFKSQIINLIKNYNKKTKIKIILNG